MCSSASVLLQFFLFKKSLRRNRFLQLFCNIDRTRQKVANASKETAVLQHRLFFLLPKSLRTRFSSAFLQAACISVRNRQGHTAARVIRAALWTRGTLPHSAVGPSEEARSKVFRNGLCYHVNTERDPAKLCTYLTS